MDFTQIIGHEDIIKHFKSSIEMDRISHAYIICGEEDSGKKSLAKSFAKTLQCEKEGTEPCNECQSCHQAETGNHPDIIRVSHEKAAVITVDEIREQVVNSISVKPYKSKYKIYIIEDAQLMNQQAQNALLKTIEEPPEYGIIILLTTGMDKLLPTIVSRCIVLNTKPVKERDIMDYLTHNLGLSEEKAVFCMEYAQGNLGKAIKLATNDDYAMLVNSVIKLETNIYDMDMESIQEAITDAEHFKFNVSEYLDLMMMWYRDILMLKVTGKIDKIMFKDQYSIIKKQASYLSYNELEKKSQAIEKAKTRLNANAKFEDVMKLLIMSLKEI